MKSSHPIDKGLSARFVAAVVALGPNDKARARAAGLDSQHTVRAWRTGVAAPSARSMDLVFAHRGPAWALRVAVPSAAAARAGLAATAARIRRRRCGG